MSVVLGLVLSLMPLIDGQVAAPQQSPDPKIVTHWNVPERASRWEGLAYAYWPEEEIATVLRIIECESNGDPQAVNPRSGASGLMQVMPFWADHFGYEREDLLDPSLNMEMAVLVWQEQGWEAWSCY